MSELQVKLLSGVISYSDPITLTLTRAQVRALIQLAARRKDSAIGNHLAAEMEELLKALRTAEQG